MARYFYNSDRWGSLAGNSVGYVTYGILAGLGSEAVKQCSKSVGRLNDTKEFGIINQTPFDLAPRWSKDGVDCCSFDSWWGKPTAGMLFMLTKLHD